MKALIKVAGIAVVMKESIKEQPCVWSLTAFILAKELEDCKHG